MHDSQRMMIELRSKFSKVIFTPVFIGVTTHKKNIPEMSATHHIYMLKPNNIYEFNKLFQTLENKDGEDLRRILISCGAVLNDMIYDNGQYIPAVREYYPNGQLSSVHYIQNGIEVNPTPDIPAVMQFKDNRVIWARSTDQNDVRHCLNQEEIEDLNKRFNDLPQPRIKDQDLVPILNGTPPSDIYFHKNKPA